jgi:hypothetical protein
VKRNLTLAPPDRLRRGYAAAFWQVLWLGGIIVLLSPAAGEPFRWAVPCKAKKLLALAIFVEWKLPFIHNDLQALIEIAILAGLIVANVFIYYFLVRS